jgi:hypothetical protein
LHFLQQPIDLQITVMIDSASGLAEAFGQAVGAVMGEGRDDLTVDADLVAVFPDGVGFPVDGTDVHDSDHCSWVSQMVTPNMPVRTVMANTTTGGISRPCRVAAATKRRKLRVC